ncbi:mediator of DNA damage checkpoint protein 1-like isoform X1 [Salvelinus fontinalis]|uniref:mediator of DNA damage checkpoint protein 1-like isoform X1 n=2 Tax=Salvelinus fontinalis TaxID=8038 RepID=UPI002486AD97|nr:mediator of DNA damage checkpoint protein 1-like isoform X1 [Salvelinus fontinalis]
MEATQLIDDSILEESEEEDDGEKRGEPLAKLRVLKNKHITETELPLYQGENVLGRNPDSCSLPLVASSVSKQHTVISISMFRGNRHHGNVAAMETEALVWDLGSMNGTRKGRTKLTPHVRYALTEGECVVIADIPCQYVSVDQRGGQGHMQNPTNAHSGKGRRSGPDRKAQLRGSPSGQVLGRETGTPKTERPTEGRGVNGEMGAPSLTELGGKGKTLAKPLLFEQTPTQPERTLVPESDSDGEQEGRRDKRGKYFVSDSDSHMSSPTCSTFLSPTNKVIPESEEESPITPSSSAKNRPKKVVSFSEEESDMDGPRQQPRRRRPRMIVDDSEEEEEGNEGKEALGEKETGKRTRGKEDVSVVNQVSQAERDGPMASTEDKFNMDSDTDVEGEEEMGLSAPVNAVKPPAATEPPTTDSDPGQIHMDSDTDVEEGDTMDGDSKLMLTAADVERKPVDSVPVVQPTEIHFDSDTDVDDDDVVVSDSATNVTSFVSDPVEKPDGSAPAVPPAEFHLDTDTDVEEEDTDTHSKTVPESDSSGIRTGIAGHQEILLDSDTDEEDNPFAPPTSSRTAELLNPPTSVGPAAAAPLEIRSDSDTDLEEDATQTMNLPPPNVATVTEDAVLASRQAVLPSPTTTTTGAVTKTIALRSSADTDAEEERLEPKPPRCRPPAGMVLESDLSEPSDFRMDSDTEEDGPGEAGQGQTGGRLREGAAVPGLLPLGGSPGPHQKCSTPLASSVQEEMETQAFLSPSDPFRHPALPPVPRPTAALSCSASDSQEDDDFVVAETQSFVLESQNQGHQSSLPVEPTLDATQPYSLEPSLGEDREEQPSRGSFHLGLSDSSHLHLQARDQASESTQAFSFPDGDSDLEATQTYGSGGGSEEPGLRSAVFGRNRQVDFAVEATQAYAAQPRSDTEEEDEEETQPLEFPTPSNVATTETLPKSAYEEEDSEEDEDLVGAKPLTPVRRGRSGGAREREEEEQETQTGEVLTNQYLSTAQTLDMVQESDDEEEAKPDSPRRRPQKQTVDEEETQTVGSYLSTAETQPMFTAAAAEDDDNEEEELKPLSPRRRGRSRRGRVEEEETQPSEFLTSSQISTAETQPMGTCDTEEEKGEDTKAKGQAQRGRGKESEAGTSGVSSRGRRGARGGEEESSEPLKTQMRGKGKAVNTAGGRREVLPEEEESEKEEEAEVVEQGRRGRKSVKQQKEGEKERLEEERREEKEGIEKERQEQAEKERLQKEKVESERVTKEQQDRERMEQELKEQDERLERESVEREETERMEREEREQEERERLERERKEREEQERLECERVKREEKERLEEEKERIERERKEIEERKRQEREEKEKQERLERESREREALERLERERVEEERIEGEQAEKQRLEKERKEILEKEKREREEKRKQERELLKKKKEEKERLDRETKERNLKEKLEREKKEREKREAEEKEKEIKERQAKEQGEKQAKKDNENEPKTSTRGRRATTRRTVTVPPTTEPQPELDILSSQPEPVPASITRSRSNSSNSVSSERSSIGTLGSRGRGGRKTTSTTEPAPGPDNPTRNSTRRRTLVGAVVAPPAAVEVTVQDILSSEQFVARRTRSRSSSTNSHSSTNSVSTCIVASVSSQSKGRGGGRRRKTGTESVSPSNRQSEQLPAPKPTARGRRSQKVEDDGPHPEINEKADSQEAGGTTRGQKKTAKTNEPDPVVADEETTPAQVTEDSPAPRGNGRGRGRGRQRDNTPESTTTTAGGDTPSEEGVESKTGGRGKGRKRGLEEEQENSGFKVPRRKAKVQRGGRCRTAEEEGEKEENPASTPAKRGRASTAHVKKIAEEESMEGQSEKMEEAGTVQRKVRGRQSTVQIKKEEESVLDSNSVVPQTPTGKGRGKRRAPVESSPLARTPRSSSASPLSSFSSSGTLGSVRADTQSYKVLFTGVVDEEGGKVVSRLGGSLAKGVADMTHLVTDRVRRTVKFLCAVARGVPVVTTDWLDKCGKVGRFLPTDRYLVKDREQENKFSFCLEESLRTASTQPLLQGYEVHVTRSVLPEPAQMKDIIVCSRARFLSTMPSTQKAQARTLVISCGEDWSLCAPALSASLPVLSAEFLLTGILQQRVDLETHVLSAPKPRAQPGAKGQARGRKRM